MKKVSIEAVTDREDTDEILEFQIPPVDTLTDFETAADASATLEKVLATIPEADQMLIKMHIEGMSFEEIANALEMSVPETRVRYHKMVSALRYRLKSRQRKARTS